MKFNVAYYIVEGGEVLDACQRFKADYMEWHENAFKYLRGINGEAYQANFAGKIFAVKFKNGMAPKGFKKPNKQGCCYPYAKSEWPAKFEALGMQPQPDSYLAPIIKAPRRIMYECDSGWGGGEIGHPWAFYQILWFSKNGPFCVVLPDVEKEIANILSREESTKITSDTSFNIPHGLRRIIKEEWDFIAAKHHDDKKAECA